jgi:hypothetical protein
LRWKGIGPTVLLMDPQTFQSARQAEPLSNLLADMGIARCLLSRDLLQRSDANPALRQNQWRVTGTGRAVATRPQQDISWRQLG